MCELEEILEFPSHCKETVPGLDSCTQPGMVIFAESPGPPVAPLKTSMLASPGGTTVAPLSSQQNAENPVAVLFE